MLCNVDLFTYNVIQCTQKDYIEMVDNIVGRISEKFEETVLFSIKV